MNNRRKYDPEKPVLSNSLEREESIRKNTASIFRVKGDAYGPHQNSGGSFGRLWDEVRTFDSLGRNAVRKYDQKIDLYAKKHNLDPDMTRAVIYAENARGHHGGLNQLADFVGRSESVLPMNIQKSRWAALIAKKPEDMYDPDTNIEASTVLLRRIGNRVERANPEKIGSVWHYTGAEKTDEFGRYVGRLYWEKPWAKFD